jgi:hypothetical protein
MAQLATSEELLAAEHQMPMLDLSWLAGQFSEQYAWKWMLVANCDPDDWRTKRERTK